ncbi:RipA family octameric membrane protein [Paracidovorax konjaci]|uniref:Uncharacterized protein n=1 Tax=Paracidovorax konjaci TaxID=32040 RepID=A0A1I1RHV8_9BURK|nr:hypothetical protein [Paracidovorax konjaci]SFD33904.1 hypothetical protein SAMN04489710_101151 [Paracidovorax konjaci]
MTNVHTGAVAPEKETISAAKLYEIALDTRNLEINLFWQRCNYFLVLNSGLAVGFFNMKESPLQVPTAILGSVVCLLWYRVALGSKYWQERWEDCLRRVERELRENNLYASEIPLFSADWRAIRNEVRESLQANRHVGIERAIDEQIMSKPSVTLSMFYLVIAFGSTWLGLIVYGLIRVLD